MYIIYIIYVYTYIHTHIYVYIYFIFQSYYFPFLTKNFLRHKNEPWNDTDYRDTKLWLI